MARSTLASLAVAAIGLVSAMIYLACEVRLHATPLPFDMGRFVGAFAYFASPYVGIALIAAGLGRWRAASLVVLVGSILITLGAEACYVEDVSKLIQSQGQRNHMDPGCAFLPLVQLMFVCYTAIAAVIVEAIWRLISWLFGARSRTTENSDSRVRRE